MNSNMKKSIQAAIHKGGEEEIGNSAKKPRRDMEPRQKQVERATAAKGNYLRGGATGILAEKQVSTMNLESDLVAKDVVPHQGKENLAAVEPEGKFNSLAEALEVLKDVDLGCEEEESKFAKDMAENKRSLDTYFDECDLIHHIPISQNVQELQDFLVKRRNEGKS